VAIEPLILGGEQERGLRAGTENVLGIVALGEAADRALGNLPKFLGVEKLKERLLNGILTEVDQVVVNGAPTDSPNTLNVSFLGAEGESIMLMLDEAGVEVSTGSACAARSIEPSHVIMAMGGNAELAHGSVRFSLGLETTRDEVDYVIKTLPPIIKKLRAMSARRI
jgi:cysteine desulfurase